VAQGSSGGWLRVPGWDCTAPSLPLLFLAKHQVSL